MSLRKTDLQKELDNLGPGPTLLLLCLAFCPASFSADDLQQGMNSYRQKDYKEARRLLTKAVKADPYNAELHYYLANSMIYLGDGKAAMAEYSQSFDLDPFSKFGQYSREALLGFGKKFNGIGKLQEKDNKHLPPDDGKSIKQAVIAINSQTSQRESLNRAWGEHKARAAIESGEERNRRLRQKAEEQLEELSNSAGHKAGLQEEMHEIQQKAVFEGQRAQADAREQAARHMGAAMASALAVESSATNLLRLISEKAKPGKVKLRAAGTNLYVRSYGSEPAPVPEPLLASWELLPQAQALPPQERSRVKVNAEAARAKKEGAPRPVAVCPQSVSACRELTQIDGRVILHIRDRVK